MNQNASFFLEFWATKIKFIFVVYLFLLYIFLNIYSKLKKTHVILNIFVDSIRKLNKIPILNEHWTVLMKLSRYSQ